MHSKLFPPAAFFFAECRPTGSAVVITASPVVHLIRISRGLSAFCKHRSGKQPIRERDRFPPANNIRRTVLQEINSFSRVVWRLLTLSIKLCALHCALSGISSGANSIRDERLDRKYLSEIKDSEAQSSGAIPSPDLQTFVVVFAQTEKSGKLCRNSEA